WTAPPTVRLDSVVYISVPPRRLGRRLRMKPSEPESAANDLLRQREVERDTQLTGFTESNPASVEAGDMGYSCSGYFRGEPQGSKSRPCSMPACHTEAG